MSIGAHEPAAARSWERLAADHPELGPAIDFQRRALSLLQSAAPSPALPETGASETRARMLAGVPLIAAAQARFTEEPPFALLAALARLARRAFGSTGAREIERSARRRGSAAEAGLAAALRRDAGALSAAGSELRAPATLFATLCEVAVSPSLRVLAETAAPMLLGVPWTRGYCPLCGSWPIFGELRQADKSRYLRCGLCGGDWAFARLRCPFCGESDHRRLRALHVEGEAEHRRAEVCDTCQGYVKSLARLAPTPASLLPVEDLATAYLDLLALDAGYRRPEAAPVFSTEAPRDFGTGTAPASGTDLSSPLGTDPAPAGP